MGKALLLSGQPGCGKTTLICHIVENLNVPAAGFYTQELRQEGKRLGFELVTLEGKRALLAHVDTMSRVHVGKYGVDLGNLEQVGVAAVRRALVNGCLAVIDEIGPMEITSSAFRQVVEEVLDSPIPLLGTIHYRGGGFIHRVRSHPAAHLIIVTRENRQRLIAELLPLIQALIST